MGELQEWMQSLEMDPQDSTKPLFESEFDIQSAWAVHEAPRMEDEFEMYLTQYTTF